MAEYPEGNPGAHPLDPESEVGVFRLLFGDSNSTPYDPTEPGFQNYTFFSDAEIEGFLSLGGDGPGRISRAIGYAYLQLAGSAAMESTMVKDFDLTVDRTKRAADLRALAQFWFDRADDEDDHDGGGDIFDMFDLGGEQDVIPEGTVPVFGRYYTTGRIR